MVKSAENYAGHNKTNLSTRKQKSQSCLPKKWERQKSKNPTTKQNERYRYTNRQSTSKPVQKFTVNSTITIAHSSKRSVSNDPSKKKEITSSKKITNVSVNAICGPLTYIFPNGSLSLSKEIKISQKSCESSRSFISCKKSRTNSTRQSAISIPSNAKPSSNTVPSPNITSRYRETKRKNQTVKLMSDRIIYNLAKYEEVRDRVNKAIQNRKVFSMLGRCKAVRDALRERGWVEKLRYRTFDTLKRDIPYGDTNPELDAKKKLVITNNLLLRCNPNFYWTVSAAEKIFSNNSNPNTNPLINRVRMDDKVFTTKAGLCSALKYQHWYHINGVSDVNSPRSYNIFNELEDFQADYRITACTNLLKWFVENRDGADSIISEKGKIPFSVIFFALKRCQGFIQRKQHRDIDKIIKEPNPSDWETYIDSYYKLIFRRQRLKVEHKNVMDFYMVCANEMLRFMRKHKPEIDCEGLNNIWIIKPGASSRGRGITLTNDYKTIINISTQPRVQKYVVQKYIENPLLVYGTKFDIRQYYIITNTHPLVIWMYKNCYLRFSSQKYSLVDFHESIHLTNNAIQHKYKSNINRDPKLPKHNMWALQQFRDYLDEEGQGHAWGQIIYQGMKSNIIGAMLTCQEGMVNRINQFELYGCDFILDKKFKPWLIEINSSPDMSCSTKVTAKLCPEVLEDIIKVVVDYRNDRQAPTGDFECIYRQKITQPIYSTDISSLVVCGIEESNRNSRSWNKSIGDLRPQCKEACADECLKAKQSWKNHLIKLVSEEDLLKNELTKITSNEEILVSSSSEQGKECNDTNEINKKPVTKAFKEKPNSTEDYCQKSMPVEKKHKVATAVISSNGVTGYENLQCKSNLLPPEKNSFKVEKQKNISSAKSTTCRKYPTERRSCQSLRINSLKNVKKKAKNPSSAENNKTGLSCVREINDKTVQSVKMKKDAPLKKIKNEALLKKKDLTISHIKEPIRKPIVPLNEVVKNTQKPIKEQIENSNEQSAAFNSEAPIDVLNSQMTSDNQMGNSNNPFYIVNTQPPIEQVFHSEIPLGVLNTQKLVIEDQKIYSEEPLDVVNTQLSIEKQIVNSEISVDTLNTQQLPNESQIAYSEELLDDGNTQLSIIEDEIEEVLLDVVNTQLPIIKDQIENSEEPLDVANTQQPIIKQVENSEEPLDVVNTQLPIFEDQIKNSESLDVVNAQLEIIDDRIENSEEPLDVVYTQLPFIEDKNKSSEELLDNRKKSLPISENNNQLNTSTNIQGRTGYLKKKIRRIGDNSKQFHMKKSLSQHVSRQIHNYQSAKRQQSYEKINVKKIRMLMKKEKNLLDSILNFYQEDFNKPGNKGIPFLLSTKKTK